MASKSPQRFRLDLTRRRLPQPRHLPQSLPTFTRQELEAMSYSRLLPLALKHGVDPTLTRATMIKKLLEEHAGTPEPAAASAAMAGAAPPNVGGKRGRAAADAEGAEADAADAADGVEASKHTRLS